LLFYSQRHKLKEFLIFIFFFVLAMDPTSFPGYATLAGQRIFFLSYEAFANAAADPSLIDACQYESAPDHGDYILSLYNQEDARIFTKIFPGYIWSDCGRIYFQKESDYFRYMMNPDFILPAQLESNRNHQSYLLSLSERISSQEDIAAKYRQLCIRKGLLPVSDRDSYLLRTTDVITSSIFADDRSDFLHNFRFEDIYSCILRAMKDVSGIPEYIPSTPQFFPSGDGYRPMFQTFFDFFRDPSSTPLYSPPPAPVPPPSVELISDPQAGFHFMSTVDRATELPSALGIPSTLQEILDFVAPSDQRTYRPLHESLSSARRRFPKPLAAPYPARPQIVLPTPLSHNSLGYLTDASTLPLNRDSPTSSVPSLISDTSTLSNSTTSSKKAIFIGALDPTNKSWKQNVRTHAASLIFPHLLTSNGDVIRRQYEKDVQSMLLDSTFQYTAAQVEQLLQSLLQRVLRPADLPASVPQPSPSHFGLEIMMPR